MTVERCVLGYCSRLAEYTGLGNPPSHTFSIPIVGHLAVVLRSDSGVNDEGFALTYEATNAAPSYPDLAYFEQQCPLGAPLQDDSGTIDFVSQGDYRDNLFCAWMLQLPSTQYSSVEISFSQFNTESGYDYVEILSCSPSNLENCGSVASFSGSSVPSATAYALAGNVILVAFRSDSATTAPGFILNYQGSIDNTGVDTYFQSDCPPNSAISGSAGQVSFKPANGYRENSQCRWALTDIVGDTYPAVTISFDEMATERDFDFVIVESCPNGNVDECRFLLRESGDSLPATQTYSLQSGEYVVISFSSDGSQQGNGFVLNFEAAADGTGALVGDDSGPTPSGTGDSDRDKNLAEWWATGGSEYFSQYSSWQEFASNYYDSDADDAQSGAGLQIDRFPPYRVVFPPIQSRCFPCDVR